MMKSRSPIDQKDKKTYMKWGFIAAGALLLLGAVFLLFSQEQRTDPVNSAAGSSEKQSAEVPEEPAKQPADAPKSVESPENNRKESSEEKDSEEKSPEKDNGQKSETETQAPDKKTDATQYSGNADMPSEPTVIKGILLVNKQHPLPETYAPGEVKEARTAFEAMRAEALKAGIDLTAFSTYRDFTRQKELYAGYVAKDGQEAADRYSARPGHSEHQTGLAFDIGESGEEQHWASSSFGDTEGGKWLMDNAHKFGFILRYPEGAEKITGYMHESWHYRYVGKEVATEIHSKGITLEEYLGVN